MSMQLGRISGPLLKDNLTRNGVDLAFETDLLYLDVNNLKIGIKSSSPTRDLFINNSALTVNSITDIQITADNNIIINNNSTIETILGELNINAEQIISSHLGVGIFDFDENKISTNNSDIEIRPTNSTFINNDVDITGSLHATGNITFDGTITFGSDDADLITFASDINSNIIPDINNYYNLGDFGNNKRWNNIYAGLLNGQIITINEALVMGSGTSIEYRQGNIWYVATNGHYDNVGNHPNGPFDTIERALKNATDGDTVYIYPGIYYELFPLIVPEGVTVKGCGIRNVVIKPDTSSTHEDVFLLNDRTTISDLTIEDFYFDNFTNKGFAFRFASGIKITSRSPYIQNVSVITKGSVTSISDPLGYDQHDAGKGAYIDGSVANNLTNNAAMVFESVTFITPGVDSVIMINGVRVELVNSFIYFANRGLYAIDGTGRLLQDNVTLAYGAEVRCINSSISYGEYGAVADGPSTLINLINHNFAFVGSGKNSNNDYTLTVQDNEIVKLNNGDIHYVSMDQFGVYRVGDIFWVDQTNNSTSMSISSLQGTSIEGLKFIDNNDVTFIDSSKIEVGNFRFNDNLIRSLNGPINVESASGDINLNINVDMAKDLAISNNFKIDGVLYLGNQPTDSVVIYPKLDQDINPKYDNSFNLGSNTDRWLTMWLRSAHLSDIKISTNYIRSTVSNENLDVRTLGSGSVFLENIKINENLIYTSADNIQINSATTLDIFGNTTFNGKLYVTQNLTIDSNITFGITPTKNINIVSRVNSVIHPQVNNVYSLGDSNRSWNLYTGMIQLDDIEINDNYIRTTVSNLNLELKANGSGAIRIEKVDFNENIIRTNGSNKLIIDPATTLDIFSNTNINANLLMTGDFRFDGDITIGDSDADNIVFYADINSNLVPNINNLYDLGSLSKRWRTLYSSNTIIDDIEINTNYIQTTNGNKDLILQGNSAGGILTEDLRFRSNTIESKVTNQNIQINLTGTSILDTNTDTALKVPSGTTAARPTANMLFGDMRFNTSDNLFGGYTSARVTFGGVYSADRLTYARVEPTLNIINFITQGTTAAYVDTSKIWLNGLTIDNFSIQNNIWSTNNNNIIFDPDGNNIIDVEEFRFDDTIITNNVLNQSLTIEHTNKGYLEIKGSLGFIIPTGDDAQRPSTPEEGTMRWSTDEDYLEIYINGAWGLSTGGAQGYATPEQVDDINTIYTLILG